MTAQALLLPEALAREAAAAPVVETVQQASPPFRFYDNRQKYLAFVNTCNEKAAVAARVAGELRQLHPSPRACVCSMPAWATRPCCRA